MTTNLNQLLDERGKRHGDFKGHAEVTQALKEEIISALVQRQKTLDPDQQEALDMICHKSVRLRGEVERVSDDLGV